MSIWFTVISDRISILFIWKPFSIEALKNLLQKLFTFINKNFFFISAVWIAMWWKVNLLKKGKGWVTLKTREEEVIEITQVRGFLRNTD